MDFQITGVIEEFKEIQKGIAKVSGNEWQKQEFVISNNEGYNDTKQVFCFEVFGDKVESLTKFQNVGDTVTVKFNIKCNEHKGNHYTSLSAWRIEKQEGKQPVEAFEQVKPEDNDPVDLPF